MRDVRFKIQPYTQKELAGHYCCSVRTLTKWLEDIQKELGPRAGYYYNPKQVRAIVDHLGEP